MSKRTVASLLVLWMLFLNAFMLAATAEQASAQPSLPTVAPTKAQWPVLPPLTAEGYLAPGSEPAEFVHADVSSGLWIYISSDLHIEIVRYSDPNLPLIWYEADIRTAGRQTIQGVLANPKAPANKLLAPEAIARQNNLVFAINDDHFVSRITNRETVGVCIRGGKILTTATRKNGAISYPNLETLALFGDGSAKVYQSHELTAEEYLAMGATDVFAFGPILLRDGAINELLYRRYSDKQPRCSFGMIAPYHYVSVVVEGRHKGSEGVGVLWLAQRMSMLGATQAINLDGGNTTALVFMGEKLNTNNNSGPDSNIRSLGGMIGIGTSAQVPGK